MPAYNKCQLGQELGKMMIIGSGVFMTLRYCTHRRYYLLKDYVKSALYGGMFGVLYSPYFLHKKVLNYELNNMPREYDLID